MDQSKTKKRERKTADKDVKWHGTLKHAATSLNAKHATRDN